jgi:hypothetical protein
MPPPERTGLPLRGSRSGDATAVRSGASEVKRVPPEPRAGTVLHHRPHQHLANAAPPRTRLDGDIGQVGIVHAVGNGPCEANLPPVLRVVDADDAPSGYIED